MPVRRTKEGRYIVEFQARGERVYRRMPAGTTAAEARAAEAGFRIEIDARGTVQRDPTIAEVLGKYLQHAETLRSAATARHHAIRVGRYVDVEKYRVSQVVSCVSELRDKLRGYQPATFNRSLGTIKKAISMAYESGQIPEDYGARVKRLPENNQREVIYTPDDVEKVAQNASTRVRAAIMIALYTGMRRGEIVALKREDVQADAILVRASNTKTLKVRMVPIVEPLRPWLRYIPLGLTADGVGTGWERAREAAGMPDVRFHDIRHITASALVQNGTDLYTVARILGHSRVTTTERYAHLQTEQLANAMRRVFK